MTATTLAAAVAMMVLCAPTDPAKGFAQKIAFLHIPIAFNTLIVCAAVFVGNIGYIWQRSRVWHELAARAARVAVLFSSIVLLTGAIWARQAWGLWWTWSPLLTFSLVLWMLYVIYLALERGIRVPQLREVACAIYGVIAFLDVPLVYLSVKLLPDKHPSDVHFSPAMTTTLAVWFVATTMICAGLIFVRSRTHRRAQSNQPLPAPVVVRRGAIKHTMR